MAKTVFIINGPNLNMLGEREPGIYGGKSLDDIAADCLNTGKEVGVEIEFRQTNHEGVMVDWIQEAGSTAIGLIINPGAYGHTSIALHDAIRTVSIPVVEVHLSNIHAREEFRHTSMIAPVASGIIIGLGPVGYCLALRAIADQL